MKKYVLKITVFLFLVMVLSVHVFAMQERPPEVKRVGAFIPYELPLFLDSSDDEYAVASKGMDAFQGDCVCVFKNLLSNAPEQDVLDYLEHVVPLLENPSKQLLFIDADLRTPLHYAAIRGFVTVAEWVLDNQVYWDVNAFDHRSLNAAQYAVIGNCPEMIDLFIRYNEKQQKCESINVEKVFDFELAVDEKSFTAVGFAYGFENGPIIEMFKEVWSGYCGNGCYA